MTPTSHQVLFQCRERWNAWMQNCRKHMNGQGPALSPVRVSNGNQEPKITTYIVTHDVQQTVMRMQ